MRNEWRTGSESVLLRHLGSIGGTESKRVRPVSLYYVSLLLSWPYESCAEVAILKSSRWTAHESSAKSTANLVPRLFSLPKSLGTRMVERLRDTEPDPFLCSFLFWKLTLNCHQPDLGKNATSNRDAAGLGAFSGHYSPKLSKRNEYYSCKVVRIGSIIIFHLSKL